MPDGAANYSAMHFMGLALDYLSVSRELPLDIEKMLREVEKSSQSATLPSSILSFPAGYDSNHTRGMFVRKSSKEGGDMLSTPVG